MSPLTAAEEHAFWLNILLDHAVFVRDFLSPAEKDYVRRANHFIREFEEMIHRLHEEGASAQFAAQSLQLAENYYQFEGHLQALRIKNEIVIDLTPTYLIGTLNENEEYIRLCQKWSQGQTPTMLSTPKLLNLWLDDMLGHALLLVNILDPIEMVMIQKTTRLVDAYEKYKLKNSAIQKYLRFMPTFPGENRFTYEIAETTIAFNNWVDEVIHMFQHDEVLSRTTLPFLEHHLPESCYFLLHLAQRNPRVNALGKTSQSREILTRYITRFQ
jgi:hypothetical protein